MSARANTSTRSLPPATSNQLTSPRHTVSGESARNKTSPKAIVPQAETVLLPDIKSSDNYVDKTRPLPSTLQKDYVPDDILFALTQTPQGQELLGPAARLRNINTSTVVARKPPAAVWNFPKRREKLDHLTKNIPCTCGAGKDISFLYDVPKKKEELKEDVDPKDKSAIRKEEAEEPQKSALKLPDTLIPEEYHIVKNKGVMGLEYHDDKFATKPDDHEKHLVVFPSMVPTSRYEVLKLRETLKDMLRRAGILDQELDVKGPTQEESEVDSLGHVNDKYMHNLLELIKKEQNIYNIVFHELIRQVSVECIERGELLAELRSCYSNLLNKVPRQIKSVHEEVLAQRALDRRLTEELMRFKSTIGILTGELSEVKEHDKEVTTQANTAQDELKAALNEAKKNSSLLAEYHDLYELQRKRLEKQVTLLADEKEIWSTTAYSLALKVTEEHSLNTAKRLHVSEKGWVKLGNHFTILLSDKDTEILTKLQAYVDGFRDLLDDFNRKLKSREDEMLESLAKVQIGIESWVRHFQKHILSTEGHLAKVPDKDTTMKLYNDIKHWEEMLHAEAEKFGGEVLLEGEESLYDITKRMEGWTDCALKVFGRHRSEDGANYPDHEHMMTMNLEVEELFKQYQVRLTGENGVATGLIHITNNLETWGNKFNSVVMGNNPLPDTEWIRFYQLLDDWIVNIEETAEEIGSTQKSDDKAEGLPHKKIELSDVLTNTQKWLSASTNGIDSEDAKLVEQVSGLHTDMVKWMVQMLLRLAPDREGHSKEAKEAVLMGSATVPQLKSNASNLFHQLQSFTKYVFQCCLGIVMDDMQEKIDKHQEDADHEYKDLLKLQAECEEWITVAKLMISELTGETWVDQSPQKILKQRQSPTTSTSPAPSEAHQEETNQDSEKQTDDIASTKEDTVAEDNKTGEDDVKEDQNDTKQDVEAIPSEEIQKPATPTQETEEVLCEDDKEPERGQDEEVAPTAQIEYIGHDANTHQQPLQQDTVPGAHGVPLPFEGPVKPGTPDTKKAYQALAAIETLQSQLISTEERAQVAEEKALEAENVLKVAEEKIAALERRLEALGVDIEEEKKTEEQKGSESKQDVTTDKETEKQDAEGRSKKDGDQKKKSKPSGKSRKK